MSAPLKIGVLIGSVRQGRQALTVANSVISTIKSRGHTVFVVDPVEPKYDWLAKVVVPFPYQKDASVVPGAKELSETLKAQDALILVCGEYNHAPSSTLMAMLNNFHKETWSGSVAALVNYGGQFTAGARASFVLRNMAAELDMHVIPKNFLLQAPWQAIGPDGKFVDPIKQKVLDDVLNQLEHVARALKK